jgi:2-oxoisovalerate dehydrogenase E1 component
MNFNTENLDKETLLHLYKAMVLPRTIEEKMLIALRQVKFQMVF